MQDLTPPRPPKVPGNYRPLTFLERRTVTPELLVHNRRLGWLLSLARDHGWVPAAGLPVEELIGIVREWLPDDFPAEMPNDEIAAYVTNDEDRDLALGLL